MKKLFTIFLALTIIISSMSVFSFADTAPDSNVSFSDYDTQTTWTIYNVAGLQALKSYALTNDKNFEGKTIILSGIFDMSGEKSWDGIGDRSGNFSGKLQGSNCYIRGLASSLIKDLQGGTISDISFEINQSITSPVVANTITDSTILVPATPEVVEYKAITLAVGDATNGYYTEALGSYTPATGPAVANTTYYSKNIIKPGVAEHYKDCFSLISGITISRIGTSTINSSAADIGAVVGTISTTVDKTNTVTKNFTTISNCVNKIPVYGNNAGGIVGTVTGPATFFNCSNIAEINGSTSVGGIIGKAENTILKGSLSNSGSITKPSGSMANIGAIVGIANNIEAQELNDSSNNAYPAVGLWLGENNLTKCSLHKATNVNATFATDAYTTIETVYVNEGGGYSLFKGNTSNVFIKDNGRVCAYDGAKIGRVINSSTTQYNRVGTLFLYADATSKINTSTAYTVNFFAGSSDSIHTVYADNITGQINTYAPFEIYKYGTKLDNVSFNSIYSKANGSTKSTTSPFLYNTSYAAKIGTVGYASLSEAVIASKNGDKIILQSDCIGQSKLDITGNKSITIDLNSKDIKFSSGSFYVASGSKLILDDRGSAYYRGAVQGADPFSTYDVISKSYNLIIMNGKYSFDVSKYVAPTSSYTYDKSSGYYIVKNEMKISGCKISLNNSYLVYNGEAKTPSVTIMDGSTELKPLIDYTVVYVSNYDAGRASVVIYGRGTYSGTATEYFTIQPKDIYPLLPANADNQGYTGTQIKPTITIKDGVKQLIQDRDYVLSYGTNVSWGSGTITITGKGNYSGTKTLTFKIAKSISDCSFSPIADYKYIGYTIRPDITIKDGASTLSKGSDYTLTYGENTTAGIGTIEIKGIGNYGGNKTISFKIIGKDQAINTRWTRYSKTYTSKPFNLDATCNGGIKLKYTSSDPSVAIVDQFGNVGIRNTGIVKITITANGLGEYPEATKIVTVTVKPNKAVYTVTSPSYSKMKVRITKAPGVTKYQIRYGRNGNYRNSYYTYSNSYYDTQSRTFTGLRSGSKYYVKVRAYKTMADGQKAWGNWGTIKAIRIK